MSFEDTHRFFKFKHTAKENFSVWGSEEIDMCRQYLGDNNINELLIKRKWFSDPEGLWVRLDSLDDVLVTWFSLRSQ